MKASVKVLATIAAIASSTTPLCVYADSDFGWIYRVQASMDHRIVQNKDAINGLSENQEAQDKRLSDNEFFTEQALSQSVKNQEVSDNHSARISTLEDKSSNQEGRIGELETTTVRQPALENESNARIKESEDRIEGDAKLNERTDKAFGTLANHEDRIVDLEGQQSTNTSDIARVKTHQKADHDKVKFLDRRHVDTANRINGLDRKTDQNAKDASYAVGKVDYLDKEHIATNNQVYQQADHLKALDADQIRQDKEINGKASKGSVNALSDRVSTNENRTTQVEGRTTALEGRTTALEVGQAETNQHVETNRQNIQKVGNTANSALKVGNSAYTQAQRNTLRLDGHDADIATLNRNVQAVDQKSIERSRLTLEEANNFTQNKFDQLNSRVDKVQKEERSGIAGVAAIAGMPAIPGYKWQTSFGAGSFKDASAVAMGVFYQPTPTDAFKFAGALTNGGSNNAVFSGGFTHAW